MEHSPTSRSSPGPQPNILSTLKESVTEGVQIVTNMEPVPKRSRQLQVGALLGTSVLFIVALLGVQHLDTPLTVASIAFAVAIPLLAIDFGFASMKFKPGPGEFVLNVLYFTSYVFCEAVGSFAVFVGIIAVVRHIGGAAAFGLFASVVLFIVACFAVVGAIFLRLLLLFRRAEATGGSTDAGDLVRSSKFLLLFRPSLAQGTGAAVAHQGSEDTNTPPSP